MKKYAVIQKWKDNTTDFAVLEYFETIGECEEFIKLQKKDRRYEFDIAMYE